MKNLIFRVDADNRIGTGHLMRCLALAQAWQDTGGRAIFVTACNNEGLLQRLEDENIIVHRLPEGGSPDEDVRIMAGYGSRWVVLDGYQFGEDCQQKIKEAGYKLLVIDDMAHLNHYHADIILNQNLHAELLHYSCRPGARLLMGADYVLLRREFLAYKGCRHKIANAAGKILLTMGGMDAGNNTPKMIKALQKLDAPQLEVTAVIGGSNPHYDEIKAAADRSSLPVNLVRNAADMPALMAQADIAVCSGGTTVWELAFMGVPSVIAATTPIEEYTLKGLDKMELYTALNWVNAFSESQLVDTLGGLIDDKEARRNMSLLGQSLVDGNGCGRVIDYISKED